MAFSIYPPAQLTASGSVTALPSLQRSSSISGSGTVQAIYGIGRTVTISGSASLLSYSVSPQTPGYAAFVNIIGAPTVTVINSIPNVCECPEWINLLPTTCGWEVGSLENTTTVLTSGYDLPFTLPVFRWHILTETVASTTVVQSYNYGDLLSGVYKNPNSTICNTTRPATLAKQFKRQGCM
jgi:hypothetical protein